MFTCPICKRRYRYFPWLARHIRQRHNIFLTLECPLCKKKFGSEDELWKHLATHAKMDKKHLCIYLAFSNRQPRHLIKALRVLE